MLEQFLLSLGQLPADVKQEALILYELGFDLSQIKKEIREEISPRKKKRKRF